MDSMHAVKANARARLERLSTCTPKVPKADFDVFEWSPVCILVQARGRQGVRIVRNCVMSNVLLLTKGSFFIDKHWHKAPPTVTH